MSYNLGRLKIQSLNSCFYLHFNLDAKRGRNDFIISHYRSWCIKLSRQLPAPTESFFATSCRSTTKRFLSAVNYLIIFWLHDICENANDAYGQIWEIGNYGHIMNKIKIVGSSDILRFETKLMCLSYFFAH